MKEGWYGSLKRIRKGKKTRKEPPPPPPPTDLDTGQGYQVTGGGGLRSCRSEMDLSSRQVRPGVRPVRAGRAGLRGTDCSQTWGADRPGWWVQVTSSAARLAGMGPVDRWNAAAEFRGRVLAGRGGQLRSALCFVWIA